MTSQPRPESCAVDSVFLEHFRCPDHLASFEVVGRPSSDHGFYRFGADIVCYGRSATGSRASRVTDDLYDAMNDVAVNGRSVRLPFFPCDVITGLRHEKYVTDSQGSPVPTALADAYYLLRPLLGVAVRKHLQRAFLRNWRRTPFPNWPVDTTVEQIFEKLMLFCLKRHGIERVPFVWFWPDGHQSCVLMTHDVETSMGQAFVPHLMDLDEAYGIRASFQIVPEGRYEVCDSFLTSIRTRGFEVGVHDFNHDGRLFSSRETFERRVIDINRYGEAFQAEGFRSAVLYRQQDWFEALNFVYDMSVPTTGHLEAQPGGCCSVMPYFNGRLVELPVTTTQDYSLFHVLGDYSIDLWKRQIAAISERHGMVSFIVHPDYVTEPRPRSTYENLLSYLCEMKSKSRSWFALPGQVAKWWKLRSQMSLIQDGDRWQVTGPGSERARVAHATLEDDRVVYRLQPAFLPLSFDLATFIESPVAVIVLVVLVVASLLRKASGQAAVFAEDLSTGCWTRGRERHA